MDAPDYYTSKGGHMTPLVNTLQADLVLDSGSHKQPNDAFAACVMEAVAYVAGEPWSDHPECACPVIGAFLRSWNDSMNDEDRQILLPLVPRLVGTRSTAEVEEQRAWMATDWLVREFTPAWLRLAGLDDHAHTLEKLATLTDSTSAREAQPSVDAAGAAAGAAAWAAAGAAWAADAAAGAAAGAAAWAAAGAAAWAAAWAAAGAAGAALRPTVKVLQVSALALVERMIEAGGES